jgi:hypothetical protein
LAPGGEEILDRPMKAAEASTIEGERSVLRQGASDRNDAARSAGDDAEPSASAPTAKGESRLSLGDLWAEAGVLAGDFAQRTKELWQQAASRVDSVVAALADRSANDAEPVVDAWDLAGARPYGCDYYPGGDAEMDAVASHGPRAPEPDLPDAIASSGVVPIETVGDSHDASLQDVNAARRTLLLGAARLLDHLGYTALDCSCRLQSLVSEGDRTASR